MTAPATTTHRGTAVLTLGFTAWALNCIVWIFVPYALFLGTATGIITWRVANVDLRAIRSQVELEKAPKSLVSGRMLAIVATTVGGGVVVGWLIFLLFFPSRVSG